MPLEIETLTPTKISFLLEIESEKVKEAEEKVFSNFSREIQVKGFRKGKTPRLLVEKQINPEAFQKEVVNRLLPPAYQQALKSEKIKPVSPPRYELVSYEKGQSLKAKITLEKRPEIPLASRDYKGIEVAVQRRELKEEDVEKTLASLQEHRAAYVDSPEGVVEEGRGVLLDFQGTVDGKVFEGGKMKGGLLDVRKDWPGLPGFMEQIIGMKAGDSREVRVTLPAGFDPEVAGKEAKFQVRVHAVKEKKLPPLDDAFAQSAGKFQNMTELRDSIRNDLQVFLKNQEKEEGAREILETLTEKFDFPVPEALVEEEVLLLEREIFRTLERAHVSLKEYLTRKYPEIFAIQGPGDEEKADRAVARFQEDLRPAAVKNEKIKLILEEIAEAENLRITKEEFNHEIRRIAGAYAMTPEAVAKRLRDPEISRNFLTEMLRAKAVLLIRENLKISPEEEKSL